MMRIKPNETVLKARVRRVEPEPDGEGANLHLEILGNESPAPDRDFLRPENGSTLTVYAAGEHGLKVGDVVRARAKLLGGPGGERAVLESSETLAHES
jgi:hypothetical protein